jgi:hypothetical protein
MLSPNKVTIYDISLPNAHGFVCELGFGGEGRGGLIFLF